MAFRTFYSDYCEGKSIDGQNPVPQTLEEMVHSMDCVLHMPANFIGFVDRRNVTLQFVVNDDKSIDIDIPIPERRGSYVKTATLQECLGLVRSLGDTIEPAQIHGLSFQQW